MTLIEAVTHVRAHLAQEGCDEGGALGQLRKALGEGEVSARWAADPPPPLGPLGMYIGSPPLFSSDAVPTDALFWDLALIFLDGDGRVVHQSFLFNAENSDSEHAPRPRGLFLLRSRKFELWPLPPPAPNVSDQTGSGSSGQTPRPRPQLASKSQILDTARTLYQQAGNNPPNLTKAEQLIASLLPGTPRGKIRPILQQEEFAALRRKAGNQPKA
jgi:hypothetical protein